MKCTKITEAGGLIEKLLEVATQVEYSQRFDDENLPSMRDLIILKRYRKLMRHLLQEKSCSATFTDTLLNKIQLYSKI